MSRYGADDLADKGPTREMAKKDRRYMLVLMFAHLAVGSALLAVLLTAEKLQWAYFDWLMGLLIFPASWCFAIGVGILILSIGDYD